MHARPRRHSDSDFVGEHCLTPHVLLSPPPLYRSSRAQVFAPTNAAFDALPEGVLEDLLKPENKAKLAAILTYHVIGSTVLSTDLKDGMMPTTLQGQKVTVGLHPVTINGAAVTAADMLALNGVVHEVEAVLLPVMTVVDVALSDDKYSTLVTALAAADLVDTLKGGGPFTASSNITCTRPRGGIATLISLESIV